MGLSRCERLARQSAGKGVPALGNRATSIDLIPRELTDGNGVGRVCFMFSTVSSIADPIADTSGLRPLQASQIVETGDDSPNGSLGTQAGG